jgi:hypothetical protein
MFGPTKLFSGALTITISAILAWAGKIPSMSRVQGSVTADEEA